MTDDQRPDVPTDPFEAVLAARFEQAAAGVDGGGVSRDGVGRAVAGRARGRRRARTALVGVAAAVALLGGAAVVGTIGGDDTRVRTDDQADAPTGGPCPSEDVTSDEGPFTGQGVEIDPETASTGSVVGDTSVVVDQEPVTTLTEDELGSAATLLQVLDQADPAAYLAFVASPSSDFTASPERQAFARTVRALHPYTGPSGASFPDGSQRQAIDDYAATLPAEVFVGGAGAVPSRFDAAEVRRALTLLGPLGIDEGAYLFALPALEQDADEIDDAFLALIRSGAAPDSAGSYRGLDADQLAALDAYVARLPNDLFVDGQRRSPLSAGPGAPERSTGTTSPGAAGDQAAPTPMLPEGVRCDEAGAVAEGTADLGAVVATSTSTTTGEGEQVPGPVGTLRAEAIDLDAVVLPVDRAEVGATAVVLLPDSPLPGASGNAVIAGRQGTDGEVFRRLAEVAVGDELRVTRSDGEVLVFLVDVGPLTYPEAEEDQRLADLADETEPRLTLVTYGSPSPAAERFLVSAVLSHTLLPGAADGPG